MILYANIVKGERKKASKLDFLNSRRRFLFFPSTIGTFPLSGLELLIEVYYQWKNPNMAFMMLPRSFTPLMLSNGNPKMKVR